METPQSLALEEKKVIVFRLENEEYGVDVYQVKSIERVDSVTRVPRTPSFIKGVINLRGVITPVIDLRERFELPMKDYTDSTRIIIVNLPQFELGLIVDSATDVIDIPAEAIEPPPLVIGGAEAAFLKGVAKIDQRLLILLDLEKILEGKEISLLQNIEGKIE